MPEQKIGLGDTVWYTTMSKQKVDDTESRWERTTKTSDWHFDPMQKTEDILPVCQFTGDWKDIVDECKQVAYRHSHGGGQGRDNAIKKLNEMLKQQEPGSPEYKNTQEQLKNIDKITDEDQLDWIKVGADPDTTMFDRANTDDLKYPQFLNMVNYLGLQHAEIKFHNQKPSNNVIMHIDDFTGRKNPENKDTPVSTYENTQIIQRFFIFLDDYKIGQLMQFGNTNIHQWKSGYCFTWEWKDIPHGTANVGYHDRPILVITGWVTDQTKKILQQASFNTKIGV